jgi:hypothetical protein
MFYLKNLISQYHESIQEFRRMERIWRLYGYRRQVRNFNQQNPPVFHLCIYSYYGLACYYLYGAGILEEYQEVYLGGEEKSLVLFIIYIKLRCIVFKKELFV